MNVPPRWVRLPLSLVLLAALAVAATTLPLLVVVAAVIGICFLLKSKMEASFTTKQSSYKAYEMSRLAGLDIEKQVASQREHVTRWQSQLAQETASQLRIAFRGTFRTMQRAFLELETRMPQLQLQELKIDPSSTQSSLLNIQVNYTAWEN